MLSIGELARASGLSVSALRFYDKAGVLTPHAVDPRTGYRWYTDRQVDAAVLVAAMRRVGMPVKEMAAVLSGTDAHELLDRHLGRLEQGLDDARRELTRIHRLLDARADRTRTVVLRTADLRAAVGAVRFAADADSEFPVLRGCLFEADHDVLRLVTTDRYRLAVGTATVLEPPDQPISVVVPCTFLDDAAGLLRPRHGDRRRGSRLGQPPLRPRTAHHRSRRRRLPRPSQPVAPRPGNRTHLLLGGPAGTPGRRG
nr:MerR family transcriptional regulator [Rhodococcus koreensis]